MSSIAYYYAGQLVHLITNPAGKLYYMNPLEAFLTYLKVAIFAGFLASFPIIAQQVWAFIVPALTKQERKTAIFFVPTAILLFFMGLAFSFYLILPVGVKFLMGFSTDNLQPLLSVGQYVSFVISFLLPFGFIFELPLCIIVASKLGLIHSQFLIAKRKLVIVLSFVIGLFIAPAPDIFSQTLVAVPLILLYEISIFIVKHILHV
jgi:sec-independent protein translocase protein TatC